MDPRFYLSLLADLEGHRQKMPREKHRTLSFMYPVLLEDAVLKIMDTALRRSGAPARQLRPTLEWLKETSRALAAGGGWSAGAGPFEQCYYRCEMGMLTWEGAAEQLREPISQVLFSAEYIRRLAQIFNDHIIDGEWEKMRKRVQLVRTVMEGHPLPDQAWRQARLELDLAWLDCIHGALSEIADGRLYREGVRDAEAMIAAAERTGDSMAISALTYRAGVMILDAYCGSGMMSTTVEVELGRRQQRFVDQMGRSLAGVPESEWRMPPPAEALAVSAKWLDRSLACDPGYKRGHVLKARAQLCECKAGFFDDESELARVADLCTEALRLLPPEASNHIAATRAMLERAERRKGGGGSAPSPGPPRNWRENFEAQLKRSGTRGALDELVQLCSTFSEGDAENAWRFIQEIRPLFDQYADEEARDGLFQLATSSMFNLARERGVHPRQENAPVAGNFAELVAAYEKRATAERWSPEKRALGALAMLSLVQQMDAEAEYLPFLQQTLPVGPALANEMGSDLLHLRAMLEQGAGSNAWKVNDVATAAQYYGASLETVVKLQRPKAMLSLLAMLRDTALRAGENIKTTHVLIAAFWDVAIRVEYLGGAPATRALQQIYDHVLAALAKGRTKMIALLLATQLAKGMRFAAAMSAPPESRRQEDAQAQEITHWVDEFRKELNGDVAPAPDAENPVDDEMVLTAFIEPPGDLEEDTARARFVHACRRLDEQLFKAVVESARTGRFDPLTDEQAKALLDERTVLIQLHIGHSDTGRASVLALAMTSEEMMGTGSQMEMPSGVVQMSYGDRQIQTTYAGVLVSGLRKAVQDVDLIGPATPEALAQLETALRLCLGHLPEKLAELRQRGKDHLCFVPHGAFHFVPFHLLSLNGRPLADDWTVTTLPNLSLLRRAVVPPAQSRALPLAAFGLGFAPGNVHQLPPIPEARTEAIAVSKIFGNTPVLDAEATEERFTVALQQHRFVHLATHGENDAVAPAFQAVFLTPGQNSDGRLEARELQRLDLRGLEMVTLSACQTGLGRFDLADNLRGLPASFFLSGVETFVGALWNCDSAASECFFTALYAALYAKRSRRDAFRDAQLETRRRFPQYRDWGAFFLAGAWT